MTVIRLTTMSLEALLDLVEHAESDHYGWVAAHPTDKKGYEFTVWQPEEPPCSA